MNKFSNFLFESLTQDEVKKYFKPIQDILGNPSVANFKVGDKTGYILKWDPGHVLEEYTEIKKIDKLSKVFNSITELDKRDTIVMDYITEFKLDGDLFIKLTPKS